MIKAGIYAAESSVAGELVRILINHPDVEISWLHAEPHAGRALVDIHHGMVGETDLRFVSRPRPAEANMLFICGDAEGALGFAACEPDMKIVSLVPVEASGFVYGLPELNRKAMVRGALRASVPSAEANIILLSLLPLAKEGLLVSDIDVSITLPSCLVPGSSDVISQKEISDALCSLQPGFASKIRIETDASGQSRVLTATVSLATDLNIGELTRLYEEFYDDHNFTFIVDRMPSPREVEGTNKCLIYLDKTDGRLSVSAAFDSPLKGAAGTAVHCMNLLFGLAERIGLSLKASAL